MRLLYRKLLGVAALAALGVLAASPVRASQEQPDVPDSADCRTCHEDVLYKWDRTYHAGLEQGCTSCHDLAGASQHLAGQMEGELTPGPSFENLEASAATAVCQSCHEATHHRNWEGGPHSRRGLACIDCHSVHDFQSAKSQLKKATAADVCFGCHKQMRVLALRTSHHPVREGLMSCTSCHNPHDGSKPKLLKADWPNELCYQCHTEKRGPFLWDHAPARENCLTCHNPHGSNHDKMLVAKLPYLCQRCHQNTRHPGTLYDGSRAGTTIANSTNRAIEHACKNCHQAIHGSNAPSAPYLGR